MPAYYNEIDPHCADWLRNLIAAGLIAPGDVDERDIRDVAPVELVGYTACHFFAGIGGWSAALRLAGWPRERPVWTGSCPCQPFSAAGRREGFADERHLWPAWFHLISECRPGVVFGEQVESKDGRRWLDLVQADLEGAGYRVGPAVLPAAGVGAPHLRHRIWFVADAGHDERMEHTPKQRWDRREGSARTPGRGRPQDSSGLGDPGNPGLSPCEREAVERAGRREEGRAVVQSGSPPLSGFWSDAEWIACLDGKARPVEPGTFPLADGVPARVGKLRAYGNAIVPEVAAEVIAAYMEIAR